MSEVVTQVWTCKPMSYRQAFLLMEKIVGCLIGMNLLLNVLDERTAARHLSLAEKLSVWSMKLTDSYNVFTCSTAYWRFKVSIYMYHFSIF